MAAVIGMPMSQNDATTTLAPQIRRQKRLPVDAGIRPAITGVHNRQAIVIGQNIGIHMARMEFHRQAQDMQTLPQRYRLPHRKTLSKISK